MLMGQLKSAFVSEYGLVWFIVRFTECTSLYDSVKKLSSRNGDALTTGGIENQTMRRLPFRNGFVGTYPRRQGSKSKLHEVQLRIEIVPAKPLFNWLQKCWRLQG